MPTLKTPVTYRRFDDPAATRGLIFANVLNAVRERYPYENDRYRLELAGVKYDKPRDFSLKEQKQALLSRGSLYWRLKGRWRLVDKATGQVVDKRDSVLAHVPWMTQRGTFIHRGSEYTVANQMRLRPGVYTRRKENGQLEAHFNILPGTGRSFRVHMDPESGIFKMQVGQAHIPLYPLLQGIGVSDEQLGKWWGKDLLNANRQQQDMQAVNKVYKRMVGGTATAPAEQSKALMETFNAMSLDPDVIAGTLGPWLQQESPQV